MEYSFVIWAPALLAVGYFLVLAAMSGGFAPLIRAIKAKYIVQKNSDD